MTRTGDERHVYQEDEPELFEHIEGLMFAGDTEMELDGVVYNIARDRGDRGEFYVLTPES